MMSRPKDQFEVSEVTGSTRSSATVEWKATAVPVDNLKCDRRVAEYRARLQNQPPVRTILVKKLIDDGHAGKMDRVERRLDNWLATLPRVNKGARAFYNGQHLVLLVYFGILDNKQIMKRMRVILKDLDLDTYTARVAPGGCVEVQHKLTLEAPGALDVDEPNIVFNAPYNDKQIYHIKIVNSSFRRIGWTTKTTNMKRFEVDPTCGVLMPSESKAVRVTCVPFDVNREDTNNDRITIEWTNTPNGSGVFDPTWFHQGIARFKNLPIEYNP